MRSKVKFRVLIFITLLAALLLAVLHIFSKSSTITGHDELKMSSFKTIGKPKGSFHDEAIDVKEFAYSISGKQFDFDKTTFNTAKEILKTQTFKKKPVIMDSKATLPRLVPVTAISSNHFQELTDHIVSVPKFFGADVKLVLFDLGLREEHVKAIRSIPYVDYRQFNYSKYPPHVKDLYTYAWKVLIIQEMLAEFEAILWMDASVMLKGTYLPAIDQMVQEKSGFLFFNVQGINKVISLTHPDMFDYIPASKMSALRNNSIQQANGMIIFNTLEVQRDVMKWAVLCALCTNCIAPPESTTKCPKDLFEQSYIYYINCHRFDQSLFNVLVANANHFNLDKYVLREGKRFSKLDRYPLRKIKGVLK